ncbi:MAG: hypothetical protein ACJ8J0_21345 [Longimicrobiaceae bacterium]
MIDGLETRRWNGTKSAFADCWKALALAAGIAASAGTAAGQGDSARARECPSCAEWNAPQRPFRVHGNTYYVGTHGLAAILITSPRGHVLIDGGLPESAARIEANVRAAR